MLTKRVIPCLDVKNGRVVKGVQFTGLRDAGDPVGLAKHYAQDGADELCFLDITASSERRAVVSDLVERVAEEIFIPFTVGGGLRTLEDINCILHSGADKASLNTAAFENPQIIREAAECFGSQCIVCAVDVKRSSSFFEVYLHGGRTPTGRNAVEWAKEAVSLGAGEILLTSMDKDGTGQGYDLELLRAVRDSVSVPVIASGGVGKIEHLYDALNQGEADAVLAASIFHFNKYSISQVKKMLLQKGIQMRCG